MIDSLQKLFQDTLKDLYNAEKQFLKAMPKLAKAATNPELKTGIEAHITQTQGHVERLEQIATLLEIKPTGKVCKAAQGLVEEASEHIEEVEAGAVLDAGIIICAQKNEHYEIVSYGTMIAWATQLGLDAKIIKLFQTTLDEEKATDEALTSVSGAVNKSAKANAAESIAKKASVR